MSRKAKASREIVCISLMLEATLENLIISESVIFSAAIFQLPSISRPHQEVICENQRMISSEPLNIKRHRELRYNKDVMATTMPMR